MKAQASGILASDFLQVDTVLLATRILPLSSGVAVAGSTLAATIEHALQPEHLAMDEGLIPARETCGRAASPLVPNRKVPR